MKQQIKIINLIAFFLIIPYLVRSQSSFLAGQDDSRNPLFSAVPFLSIAPDSRSTAMGDLGVATEADVFSIHWNNAKLPFIKSSLGASVSYSPWLRRLVSDMSLSYLSFFKKIKNEQSIAFSIRYFDLGKINLYDEFANPNGVENPSEYAIDGTYARKLGKQMGLGLTFRFISSNLASTITGLTSARAANSFAFDVGWYYTKNIIMFSGKESELSFGAHISNIGQKLTYSTQESLSFLPGNLRFGTNLKTYVSQDNAISFGLEFNKLLVPTPPIYQLNANGEIQKDANGNNIILKGRDPNRTLLSGIFGSFGDAPGGIAEEFREINISTGLEYCYKESFFLRLGYFHENKTKGGRQYLTFGSGFKYKNLGVDLSYLAPTSSLNNPLSNTIRFSLQYTLKNLSNN